MHVDLDSPTPEVTVLVHGPGSEELLPEEKGLHIVRRPHLQIAEHALNVFVLVTATDLPEVSEFVSVVNRRHQLRALFVREETDARWLPHWFERAGLRTLRNTLVHSDATVPRRVLTAWLHGAQDELIADASVVGDRLFLISCSLERREIAFDQVPALKSIPESERSEFELDDDGSYIHWPQPDIHIDLDAVRAALDPDSRAKAEAAKATRTQRYGAAIARLRTAIGLRQSDIKGLSERHVRRIEKGEGATSEALSYLAEAHGMSLARYLQEVAAILAKPIVEQNASEPSGTVDLESEFRAFQRSRRSGLALVPERYGEAGTPALKAGGGDFAKWVRRHAPTIPVEVMPSERRLVLRSGDHWLPLAFLVGDVALPVYLTLVANYISEKMKGALRGDRARVRLSAMYEDPRTGAVKRFDFDGDQDALSTAIKRFDSNEFCRE
jgi:transcriptional regulator with XRE-family HTH domain